MDEFLELGPAAPHGDPAGRVGLRVLLVPAPAGEFGPEPRHGQRLHRAAGAGDRPHLAPLRSLPPHPDVIPALGRLRDADYRLFTLMNSSKAVVAEQMTHAKLSDFFEALLSVEDVGKYKPHADVYRWAAGRVGADVSECLFVATHGWDVAGAAWAGMRTAFVARPGQQMFPLGPAIDITVLSLAELEGELDRM